MATAPLLLLGAGPTMAQTGYEINPGNTAIWSDIQTDVNGQLGNVSFNGTTPQAVANASRDLSTAVTNYATDPANNLQALQDALTAFDSAVETARGTDLGTLRFTESVTLDAGGTDATQRLNVGTNAASFDVANGQTMIIKSNSTNDDGGAVYISPGGLFAKTGEGTLVFSDNTTISGGAIYNEGILSLSGPVIFTGNATDGFYALGSAIYNGKLNSNVTITGPATFTDNTSTGFATANGAIDNRDGIVNLSGPTTFTNNSSIATGANGYANGGAIYNTKGIINLSGPTDFTGNNVRGDTRAIGGAIHNFGGTVTLTGPATFTGNTATATGAGSAFGGAIYNNASYDNVGTVSLFGAATFTNNTASTNGGAIYLNGHNYSTILNLSPQSGKTILFSGNQANGVANSIHMVNYSELNINGDGYVDMRDPMSGHAQAFPSSPQVTINKSGTGIWKLGGSNTFTIHDDPAYNGSTGFTVSGGTLHLYRAGEVNNGRNGAVETGSIQLDGTGSYFTLGSGATLSVGGSGHTIAAHKITLENGATLGFDAAYHDADINKQMLALEGTLTVGPQLNVDLLSRLGTTGRHLMASNDFSNAATPILTYKGQAIDDTRLAGAGITASGESNGLYIDQDNVVENVRLTWTGAENGDWNNTADNWKNPTGPETQFLDGDHVTFTDSNADTVTIHKPGVVVAGMEVSGGNYTFTGGDISSATSEETTFTDPSDHTQSLIVSGDGTTARFENDLSFANGYEIGAGAGMTFAGSSLSGGAIDNAGSFTFEVDTDQTLSHAGDLIGSGAYTKSGAGDLFLSGNANDASGAFAVSEGLLGGAFTYGGAVNVASGATLAPGSQTAIGTMNVGSASFADGSIFQVRLTETTSDKLVASGAVSVSSDATLQIAPALPGAVPWQTGDEYHIIQADGGIDQIFGSINNPDLPFLTAGQRLDSSGQNLYLTTAYNPDPEPIRGATYNQRQTNRGVASLSAGHAVQNFVANQPGDRGLWALDQLSGEPHVSLRHALTAADINFATGFLAGIGERYRQSRAAEAPSQNPAAFVTASGAHSGASSNLWVQGSGIHAEYDKNSNAAKARMTGMGLSMGVDADFDNDWLAGAALRFADRDFKVRARASDMDIESYTLALYGGKVFPLAPGRLRVLSGGAYTLHDIDAERRVMDDSLKSNYDAQTFQLFGEVALAFDLSPKVELEPYLNAAWTHTKTDGFNEKGGAAALRSRSITDDIGTTVLGARGMVQLTDKLGLAANLGWEHNFGDINSRGRMAFRDGSADFGIRGVTASRDTMLFGVGISAKINESWWVSANYEGDYGEDSKSHGGQLRVTYSW